MVSNGHGKLPPPMMKWFSQGCCPAGNNSQTRHARFPLSNFPPHILKGTRAGERANESLREFHVKAQKTHEFEAAAAPMILIGA